MEPQRRSGDESGAAQRRRADHGAAARSGDRRVAGGVAEDFPNGGGNRAYLFTVDSPDGRFSWFFQNSASAVDLRVPIVVDGRNYGAPIDNLAAAMKAAGLDTIDLWIGTGGRAVAALVLPVIKPRVYLPVHWDGLYGRV